MSRWSIWEYDIGCRGEPLRLTHPNEREQGRVELIKIPGCVTTATFNFDFFS